MAGRHTEKGAGATGAGSVDDDAEIIVAAPLLAADARAPAAEPTETAEDARVGAAAESSRASYRFHGALMYSASHGRPPAT